MKPKKLKYYFIFLLILVFIGCSSRSYEIEEIEEEIPQEQNKTTEPEIKKEIESVKEEQITTEQKTENGKEPQLFTIQLGAFIIEDNAIKLTNEANSKFELEVQYIFTDGFYKVFIGKFYSRGEALSLLGQIQKSGYGDAFVTAFLK